MNSRMERIKPRLRFWWARLNRRAPTIYGDGMHDDTLAIQWHWDRSYSLHLRPGRSRG